MNDMKIGDDVAARVPDESGTGTLGNLVQVQREKIALHADRGDVDHARRCLPEERDGGFLVSREVVPRRHRPRHCPRIVQCRPTDPRIAQRYDRKRRQRHHHGQISPHRAPCGRLTRIGHARSQTQNSLQATDGRSSMTFVHSIFRRPNSKALRKAEHETCNQPRNGSRKCRIF